MLPGDSRLRTAADFAAVVRGGRRAGTRRLVIHLLPTGHDGPPRAGFVVSGKVGNSVVRHQVTRRLRPLVREQLSGLAPGFAIVIRALPSAAGATSAELALDLGAGISAAVRKARSEGIRADAARSSDARFADARSKTVGTRNGGSA
ncbi:ribonuclease P protein component [Nakamurella sp. UYEF19]|uniref:ribonuclease P protein component n=1 Tax=Nakamurella sp. UYEF19 TaxID=1756392 RepID=UPI0033997228